MPVDQENIAIIRNTLLLLWNLSKQDTVSIIKTFSGVQKVAALVYKTTS